LPKFDKVVYIVRDPRDAIISKSRFAFTPYFQKYYPHAEKDPESFLAGKFEGKMRRWVEHVGGYLKHKQALNIHFLFYERLLHSFESEILDLLAYLEIQLDNRSMEQLKRTVDFTTMKNKDPFHVRKGRSGQWVKILTPEQKRLADKIAGPMLKLLHYSSRENETGRMLPHLSNDISNKEIEKALKIAKRSRLRLEVKWFIGALKAYVNSRVA
jgi:aryl sulfotransferase